MADDNVRINISSNPDQRDLREINNILDEIARRAERVRESISDVLGGARGGPIDFPDLDEGPLAGSMEILRRQTMSLSATMGAVTGILATDVVPGMRAVADSIGSIDVAGLVERMMGGIPPVPPTPPPPPPPPDEDVEPPEPREDADDEKKEKDKEKKKRRYLNQRVDDMIKSFRHDMGSMREELGKGLKELSGSVRDIGKDIVGAIGINTASGLVGSIMHGLTSTIDKIKEGGELWDQMHEATRNILRREGQDYTGGPMALRDRFQQGVAGVTMSPLGQITYRGLTHEEALSLLGELNDLQVDLNRNMGQMGGIIAGQDQALFDMADALQYFGFSDIGTQVERMTEFGLTLDDVGSDLGNMISASERLNVSTSAWIDTIQAAAAEVFRYGISLNRINAFYTYLIENQSELFKNMGMSMTDVQEFGASMAGIAGTMTEEWAGLLGQMRGDTENAVDPIRGMLESLGYDVAAGPDIGTTAGGNEFALFRRFDPATDEGAAHAARMITESMDLLAQEFDLSSMTDAEQFYAIRQMLMDQLGLDDKNADALLSAMQANVNFMDDLVAGDEAALETWREIERQSMTQRDALIRMEGHVEAINDLMSTAMVQLGTALISMLFNAVTILTIIGKELTSGIEYVVKSLASYFFEIKAALLNAVAAPLVQLQVLAAKILEGVGNILVALGPLIQGIMTIASPLGALVGQIIDVEQIGQDMVDAASGFDATDAMDNIAREIGVSRVRAQTIGAEAQAAGAEFSPREAMYEFERFLANQAANFTAFAETLGAITVEMGNTFERFAIVLGAYSVENLPDRFDPSMTIARYNPGIPTQFLEALDAVVPGMGDLATEIDNLKATIRAAGQGMHGDVDQVNAAFTQASDDLISVAQGFASVGETIKQGASDMTDWLSDRIDEADRELAGIRTEQADALMDIANDLRSGMQDTLDEIEQSFLDQGLTVDPTFMRELEQNYMDTIENLEDRANEHYSTSARALARGQRTNTMIAPPAASVTTAASAPTAATVGGGPAAVVNNTWNLSGFTPAQRAQVQRFANNLMDDVRDQVDQYVTNMMQRAVNQAVAAPGAP